VGVAGIGVGPGLNDADDRFAQKISFVKAHLQHARSVTHGAQIVRNKPAVTSAYGFVCHFPLPSWYACFQAYSKQVKAATLMH
jgi:hypothetical protein